MSHDEDEVVLGFGGSMTPSATKLGHCLSGM